MKLNKKGFLTIELIISSVMCFAVALLLIDLTTRLVDITNDAYKDIKVTTEKNLITKNIKRSIEDDIKIEGKIKNVKCTPDQKNCKITFGSSKKKELILEKDETTKENHLIYKEPSKITYQKNIDKSINEISFKVKSKNNYYNFIISASNMFTDENYEANIIIYNGV